MLVHRLIGRSRVSSLDGLDDRDMLRDHDVPGCCLGHVEKAYAIHLWLDILDHFPGCRTLCGFSQKTMKLFVESQKFFSRPSPLTATLPIQTIVQGSDHGRRSLHGGLAND